MEPLWQLFWAPCKIQHNRGLKSPWKILCPVYSVHQDDFQRCRKPMPILAYNRSHQQILVCKSLLKLGKLHFPGPKLQSFLRGSMPPDPPTWYSCHLSILGDRVSRRFPGKWMEGWQGCERRGGGVHFCIGHNLGVLL